MFNLNQAGLGKSVAKAGRAVIHFAEERKGWLLLEETREKPLKKKEKTIQRSWAPSPSMPFSSRGSGVANAIAALMVLDLNLRQDPARSGSPPVVTRLRRKLQHLVQLFGSLARVAGARVPVLCPTSTVSSTSLHQEASWEKDSVGGLQLLPQVHREVSRGAAVAFHILIQPVQVNLVLAVMMEGSGPVVSSLLVQAVQVILPGVWVQVLQELLNRVEGRDGLVQGCSGQRGVGH